MNKCGGYAVEYEIAFDCNKTIGVLFVPKSINNLLHRMFFLTVYVRKFLIESNILMYC